jgi:hypothetical protein
MYVRMYGSRNNTCRVHQLPQLVFTTYSVPLIHHSSFPISNPISVTFSFPTTEKSHFLPLILLARWPLAVCLDLCALHIAAHPSTIAVCWKPVYLQLPLEHASPLSVTVNRPTKSTCKPLQDVAFYIMTICVLLGTFLKPKSTFSESVGSVRRP